jgi:hypothetical protein
MIPFTEIGTIFEVSRATIVKHYERTQTKRKKVWRQGAVPENPAISPHQSAPVFQLPKRPISPNHPFDFVNKLASDSI